MDYVQRVPKTELARNTRQVIRDAQRGYTVLVESHGQAEAAILDIFDYRIMPRISDLSFTPTAVKSGWCRRRRSGRDY